MRIHILACLALIHLVSADLLFAATYDSAGRLSEVTASSGARTRYLYDAAGNVLSMESTPGSNAVPVLTSETTLLGEVGVNFNETLVSNKPTTVFAEENLPAGLTLTRVSGLISGIPTTAGVFPVNIILRDSGQASNIAVTIHIRPAAEVSWLRYAGTYGGTALADPTSASAGLASVKIGKTGSFSAVFFYKGQRIALSGTLSPTGTFSKTVPIPGIGDAIVTVAFDRFNESVTGTISNGGVVALIEASRSRVAGANATWQVGTWTFLLQATSDSPSAAPKGSGYGSMTVAKTAIGTFAAALADGTKVSGKITFNKENDATFFQSLYGGKGFLAGDLTLDDAPLLGGVFHWSHPSLPNDKYFKIAFEDPLALEGSRLTFRPAGTRIVNFANGANNARISVGQGSLTAPFSKIFTLDLMNKGQFAPPNEEKLTFSISKAGIFKGTFLNQTDNKTYSFGGTILQTQQSGGGFFLGVPASGIISLTPNP